MLLNYETAKHSKYIKHNKILTKMAAKKEKYPQNQITFSRYAKALSHPSRLLILKFLEITQTSSFGTISSVLPISKASTAQHLTVLKDSGLVICESNPPHVIYSLNMEAWKTAHEMSNKFFNPMSANEFKLLANFLGCNTPELMKISLEALNSDRSIIETRLKSLQEKGLIDSSTDFSQLSLSELKSKLLEIGFGKK